MKYFLDSAKLDEIRYGVEHWGIDGVTTNPRHILASGKGFYQMVKELAAEFAGKNFPISVEIDPHLEKAPDMIEAAQAIARISPNFCVKIPCTEQGLVAARTLSKMGVPVNVTLVFSASQALQAGRIGARFCSPFIGWREASGDDGLELIGKIARIYKNYAFGTEVIVAAVRNGAQIVSAAEHGAHIVTAGFDVFKESFQHPFTDHGNRLFGKAWDETDTRPS